MTTRDGRASARRSPFREPVRPPHLEASRSVPWRSGSGGDRVHRATGSTRCGTRRSQTCTGRRRTGSSRSRFARHVSPLTTTGTRIRSDDEMGSSFAASNAKESEDQCIEGPPWNPIAHGRLSRAATMAHSSPYDMRRSRTIDGRRKKKARPHGTLDVPSNCCSGQAPCTRGRSLHKFLVGRKSHCTPLNELRFFLGRAGNS